MILPCDANSRKTTVIFFEEITFATRSKVCANCTWVWRKMTDYKRLIKKAMQASERAYSPYSHFKVGAVLVAKDGREYEGANIENASFSVTNCAERVALGKAIFDGAREFRTIVVVGHKDGQPFDYCAPCGVCRQALTEFNDGSMEVVLAKSEDEYKVLTLKDVLPLAFTEVNL